MVIRQQNSYLPQLVRLSNARRDKKLIARVLGAQGTFVFRTQPIRACLEPSRQ
jgi:hypothetical protein